MGAKYDQLDLDERIEMSRLYEAGTSRREIGRKAFLENLRCCT